MRIGRRLFPYPVINNSKNATCFKDCDYSFSYDDVEDKDNLILKDAHISLDNKELLELLEKGFAEAVVIVECSSTLYRNTFPISTIPSDIVVPLNDLRGKVEISCFIYAKQNFIYDNDSFLDDYDGYSFEIEKYDILAVDDGFTTKIEYDESEDKKVASIFTVVKSDDPDLRFAKVKSLDKYIKIIVPEKEFGYYDNLKANDYYRNIFFASLAIPALVKCLQELQLAEDDIDAIRINHSWFESVMQAYEKTFGIGLTEELFRDIDAYELAQTLLDYGTLKAIGDIYYLHFNVLSKDDDDE